MAKVLNFNASALFSDYYFYVSILNLSHIGISYGKEVQLAASRTILSRLDGARISRSEVKILSSSTILIAPEAVPFRDVRSKNEFLLDLMYCEPVIIAGSNVVLSVELGRVKSDELLVSEGLDRSGCVGPLFTEVMIPPCVATKSWKDNYLSEMEAAHTFYSQPFRDSYKSMPVSYYHSPELVLFDEILLDSGLDLSNKMIFGALEFTGTVAYSEFCLFEKVVDILLRDQFSSVSVNISLANFYCNSWWEHIVTFLEFNPDMARRIYFELTETQPLQCHRFRGEKRLVDSIKSAGGHLVLDDFGAGFSSFYQVDLLEPEIVKVDKKLLHDARKGKKYYNILLSVVRYIMEQCGFCVVEGVENEQDLLIVESTGANLIQGKYLDKYTRADL
ncbi:EAL domain-containing protein [Pseudomonas aeruginosa]|nr:EAL domain-containing protein [Pseudomonas aeruginosa]